MLDDNCMAMAMSVIWFNGSNTCSIFFLYFPFFLSILGGKGGGGWGAHIVDILCVCPSIVEVKYPVFTQTFLGMLVF